jgi:hypothetical protein
MCSLFVKTPPSQTEDGAPDTSKAKKLGAVPCEALLRGDVLCGMLVAGDPY